MCAIAGFIDPQRNPERIEAMLQTMAHRGPDDRGIYFDSRSGVHFGHNRLSIQDLSHHGHQPFISECQNYAITFNGEVYNFPNLRRKLEALGYRFLSGSDTEVILYSFKEWGIDCIHKFIGMFAFALLDRMQNKLFLVRDRAGVKPLYYYTEGNHFLFASEIKAFHEHPGFKKEENTEVLPYYFRFGYIPAPDSIFKNCFKLEPGHYLEYDLVKSKYHIEKYWEVNDFYLNKSTDREEDILHDLEVLLEDATNLRMVSDAPVGVFLSGGYDSSLVTALLAKRQKIRTFTIGFSNQEYNEARQARQVAEYLGTDHTEYYMRERDMLDLIPSLPFFYDEPFGDSSALPTMLVSKLARQQVKVALSADGGDETFCGYSKYFFLARVENIFSLPLRKRILQGGLKRINPSLLALLNPWLPKRFRQTNIIDKFTKFRNALNTSHREEMFQEASSYVKAEEVEMFLREKGKEISTYGWEKIEGLDFMDQMMAIDYKRFMAGDVLTKVDRATMSVGLEGREPLLDHRLIEYSAGLPIEKKYRNRQGKYLLRKILYQYLPPAIADKPKAGFQVPLKEWLQGELKPLVEKYLSPNRLGENFHHGEVDNRVRNFFSGKRGETTIWFLLMYQMWKERWLG